jgi:SDR family mycofactocin-dependent oxidoreductase
MTDSPARTFPKRFSGQAVVVTGAARGQGKEHALRFAREGADVVLVDSVSSIDTVGYPLPTRKDLDQVACKIEDLDRRAIVLEVDVRDAEGLAVGIGGAVAELGRLDVLVANAGILGPARRTWELHRKEWDAVIDVNLTGVWASIKACIPHMIAAGHGGSVVLISSIAGLLGIPGVSNYVAAKHALVGLAGSLANEVAEHGIRVNTVHPTNVRTPMIDNASSATIFRPDLEMPTLDDAAEVLQRINLLHLPWVQAEDVTAAVTWLCSDEARYVTGAALPVDAGMLSKYHG